MISKYSLRTLFISTTAIALIIAVPLLILRQMNAIVCDGYNQQIVGSLVLQYMEENEGRWPSSWISLEPIFDRDHSSFKPGTFEELKNRVFVDFDANIDQMRENSLKFEKPVFRVIFAKFTSGFHPLGDPNEAIHHYFRETSLGGQKIGRRTSDGYE